MTACEKGWKFLSKNVQVSLEPNRPMVQLPRIVTGEPVPDVREGWQRTVRLAVLLRLVACTPLASVGQLAVVPPAMSMDRAQARALVPAGGASASRTRFGHSRWSSR